MMKWNSIAMLLVLGVGLAGCAPTMQELIKEQNWVQAEKQCEAMPAEKQGVCYTELLAGAREHKAEQKIQTYIEKVAGNTYPNWPNRVLYYEGGYFPAAKNQQTLSGKKYMPIINRYLKIIRYIGKGPKSIKHGEGRFYQAAEKYFNLKRRLKDYGFVVEEMDFRRFNKTDEWQTAQQKKEHNLYLNVVYQYSIEKKEKTHCLAAAMELSSVQRPAVYRKHIDSEQLWLYAMLENKKPDIMRVTKQKMNSNYYQLELDRHVCDAFLQMQTYKRKLWKEIIRSFPEKFKGHKNIQ